MLFRIFFQIRNPRLFQLGQLFIILLHRLVIGIGRAGAGQLLLYDSQLRLGGFQCDLIGNQLG